MTNTERPVRTKPTKPDQYALTPSQRAMAAARHVRQLAPDARKRQETGTRATKGKKGKAAALAAAKFDAKTRNVELALTVLDRGAPELVQAVDRGQVTVSTAAKLVKQGAKFAHPSYHFETQRQAAAEIAAGRPVAQVLAAAGIQDHGQVSFDEKTLSQTLAHLRKLTDLRARAFGTNDNYRQAKDHLELYQRAMSRWRTEQLNEPVPVIADAYGRRVPISVVPAFQTAEEIKIVCGQIDGLMKQVEGLIRRPGGELIQTQTAMHHLNQLRKVLSDAQPVSVCSYCSGPTCICRGRGWFPASRFMPQPPPQPAPAPVALPEPMPGKTEAPAPEPKATKPALCSNCRIHGYPHCPDCILASNPAVERGEDGVLYRTKPNGSVAPAASPPRTGAPAQGSEKHSAPAEVQECPMCYKPWPPGDPDCPRCKMEADWKRRTSTRSCHTN